MNDTNIPIIFPSEDTGIRKEFGAHLRAMTHEKSVNDGARLVDFSELATRLGISIAKCRELHAAGIITARLYYRKTVRFHWPSVQSELERKATRLRSF